MQTPWLIQRVEFNEKDESIKNPTFSQRFSCDYMGSSEFEFGALPKSLHRVCGNLAKYQKKCCYNITDFRGDSLFILYPEHADVQEYEEWIKQMITKELHLKEPSYLEFNITGKDWNGPLQKDSFFLRTQIWWDIENDVFFCFGGKKMRLIQHVLHNTKEKFDQQDKEVKNEKKFIFHWRDKSVNEGNGLSVEDAFRKLGYDEGAVSALDYYEEGNAI